MKTLSFPGKKVKDVAGLYYDLLKEHFEVENVGTGPDCTFIYLEETEEKDPTPIVETWFERPAMNTSKGAREDLMKKALLITAAAREERAAKARERAAEKERQDAQGIESLFLPAVPESVPADSLAPAVPSKRSWFSKVFKVFRA